MKKSGKKMLLNPYGNTVLITGASSGIGLNAARTLAQLGFQVYGISRRGGETEHFAGSNGFLKMLKADVTDAVSVSQAVSAVMADGQGVDILINAAGIGICGAVEEVTANDAFAQFNTNLFGIIRLINEILPYMRKKNRGLIINIGSVGGIFAIPFQSLYSASKSALAMITEGLRIELKPWRGVQATLIDPGDVKTGFTSARQYAITPENSVYGARFKRAIECMEHDEQSGMKPDAVTRLILKSISKKRPPIRRVAGIKYGVFVFMKRFLPARLIESLLTAMYPGSRQT